MWVWGTRWNVMVGESLSSSQRHYFLRCFDEKRKDEETRRYEINGGRAIVSYLFFSSSLETNPLWCLRYEPIRGIKTSTIISQEHFLAFYDKKKCNGIFRLIEDCNNFRSSKKCIKFSPYIQVSDYFPALKSTTILRYNMKCNSFRLLKMCPFFAIMNRKRCKNRNKERKGYRAK